MQDLERSMKGNKSKGQNSQTIAFLVGLYMAEKSGQSESDIVTKSKERLSTSNYEF